MNPSTGQPGYWNGQAWAPMQPVAPPAPTTTLVPARPGRGSLVLPRISGRWLGATVAIVMLLAGAFVLVRARGTGSDAQAQLDTLRAQQAVATADAEVKQDLRFSATDLETWYTDHQNYAMKANPGQRPNPQSHVMAKIGKEKYCLRAYAAGSSATGPGGNGTFWWYDSAGGGLQPGPSAVSPSTTGSSSACAMKGAFVPLPG
jgi:hypothetical protein